MLASLITGFLKPRTLSCTTQDRDYPGQVTGCRSMSQSSHGSR